MLRAALLMLCLVLTAFAMRANDGSTMPGHGSAMEVQQDVKEDEDGKFCDMCHSARTNTPQKFNSSPLKNGSWKTSFLLGR